MWVIIACVLSRNHDQSLDTTTNQLHARTHTTQLSLNTSDFICNTCPANAGDVYDDGFCAEVAEFQHQINRNSMFHSDLIATSSVLTFYTICLVAVLIEVSSSMAKVVETACGDSGVTLMRRGCKAVGVSYDDLYAAPMDLEEDTIKAAYSYCHDRGMRLDPAMTGLQAYLRRRQNDVMLRGHMLGLGVLMLLYIPVAVSGSQQP